MCVFSYLVEDVLSKVRVCLLQAGAKTHKITDLFTKNDRFCFCRGVRKCIFPELRSKELPKMVCAGWGWGLGGVKGGFRV